MTPTIHGAAEGHSEQLSYPRWLPSIPIRARHPALWMVGVQAVELASQTLAGVVIARKLGRAALGDFTYGFSLAAILSVVLLFGSGDVAISLYTNGISKPCRVLTTSLRIWVRGALLCAALALAWIAVRQLGPGTAWVVLAATLTLILNGLASVLNQAITAYGASHLDLAGVVISRGVLICLVSRAALVGNLAEALAGYVFAALTLCTLRALTVHLFLFRVRIERDHQLEALVWRRGRHVGAGSVFGSLSARADALMLHAWAGSEQTGLYGASYRLINGIDAASSAVAAGMYPEMARSVSLGKGEVARHVALRTAGILAVGVLALIPIAGWLVPFVYGATFGAAVPMFTVLLVAAVLHLSFVFFHKWCIANAREALLPRGQLVAAVVNLSANALLIPYFGGLGAAWATLLAALAQAGVYGASLVTTSSTRVTRSAIHEV